MVDSAAYSPDGTRIVTVSSDNTAKVWNAADGSCLFTLEEHSAWVTTAAYSPDGTRIITGGTVKILDAETGECFDTLPNVYGLRVRGVDLRALYPGCGFSDEDKALLRRYGAIV